MAIRLRAKTLRLWFLLFLSLGTCETPAQDFAYTNNNGAITITRYIGTSNIVSIPSTIDGLPVVSIGNYAFYNCTNITSVAIPNSVTNIGDGAFESSTNLGRVTIPIMVTTIRDATFYRCTGLTNVSLPKGITHIGAFAFDYCMSLTTVIIPGSVSSIGDHAFDYTPSLASVYFQGSPPSLGVYVFAFDNPIAYFLPGTTGWGSTYGGMPTTFWSLPYPLIINSDLRVEANHFGFTVSWATNASVVVEAIADLSDPKWSPLITNVLSGGTFRFIDPQWTNYPHRFYRIRPP